MMHIRDLRRDDSTLLIDLHAQLSPNSRYQRFHSAVLILKPTLLNKLLDVDGHNHVALVASDDEGVIGIARLIRHHHRRQEAEVAMAVADAWQRRGVGRQLIHALMQRAEILGISQVKANVLAGNTAALRLFQAMFPLGLMRHGGGVVDLEARLVYKHLSPITMDEVLNDLLS